MFDHVRFLLLQVRNRDDPMRGQEVRCFSRALRVPVEHIAVFDLLAEVIDDEHLRETDVFLLGGSGDYSAAGEGTWLERALESLRRIHGSRTPTFASCWGHQAMARAMGGEVVHDAERAEIGTHDVTLTEAGRRDPVFGPLEDTFGGQMGHEDRVDVLPANTTLLASTDVVTIQAYRFDDAPIYCTQFHPELNCADLEERVRQYPRYIERVAGKSVDDFVHMIRETPEAEALLPRFLARAREL